MNFPSYLRGCLPACRYKMGVIPSKKSLEQCEKLAASAFCRRRLPVVLVQQKFCENLQQAVTYIEQGRE
jgi:U3 small nucleolar ribonucleoprotein protein IMP3